MPYLLLSFLNGCVIIALGVWLLDIPLNGSLLLLAEMLLFIFLSLSIGIFISLLTDSQLVAMFAAFFCLVLFIVLSGLFSSTENMPRWAQYLN